MFWELWTNIMPIYELTFTIIILSLVDCLHIRVVNFNHTSSGQFSYQNNHWVWYMSDLYVFKTCSVAGLFHDLILLLGISDWPLNFIVAKFLFIFYTPVERQEVLWNGPVRPSVGPAFCPSTIACERDFSLPRSKCYNLIGWWSVKILWSWHLEVPRWYFLTLGTQQSKRRNANNGLTIVARNDESTHMHLWKNVKACFRRIYSILQR